MVLPNIADMPANDVSDRDLLLYIAGQLDKLHAELESFRPLLNMIRAANGKPDMVGMLGVRRAARRAARDG